MGSMSAFPWTIPAKHGFRRGTVQFRSAVVWSIASCRRDTVSSSRRSWPCSWAGSLDGNRLLLRSFPWHVPDYDVDVTHPSPTCLIKNAHVTLRASPG